MDDEHVKDEFQRMKLTAAIERARGFISQYEEGLAFYRRQVEDPRHDR